MTNRAIASLNMIAQTMLKIMMLEWRLKVLMKVVKARVKTILKNLRHHTKVESKVLLVKKETKYIGKPLSQNPMT